MSSHFDQWQNRKPIKKQYNGVVYDSSSEAVLARAFDLNNNWLVDYLPRYTHLPWKFDGHYKPDFWIQNKHTGVNAVMEFKPMMPSDTYIKNLQSILDDDLLETTDSFVVFNGNPYQANNDWGIRFLLSKHDFDKVQFIRSMASVAGLTKTAVKHRFDLDWSNHDQFRPDDRQQVQYHLI